MQRVHLETPESAALPAHLELGPLAWYCQDGAAAPAARAPSWRTDPEATSREAAGAAPLGSYVIELDLT